MPLPHRPFALIILDGWGYREATDANAIAAAQTPHWDYLWQHYPHTLISGSGRCVGLPEGQMGNSEVGHLHMGAGRIVYQDLTRIDNAIATGEFNNNPVLTDAIASAKQTGKAIHVLGLLSPGGVHSHEGHIHALLKLLADNNANQVYLHAILDGRDTPPRSAAASIQALSQLCSKLQCGEITSLIGRYYAMDRDQRWERIKDAYELFTEAKANYHASNAMDALEQAYARGENDEFIKATSIHTDNQAGRVIEEGDTVIFMNFRADRAREITQALIDPHFTGFTRNKCLSSLNLITLTEHNTNLPVKVAFPKDNLSGMLGEYLSKIGLRQLRIAETEKYAHVTFFFNGGNETPYPGEDRILIPSPKVATYDLQPQMSANELTDRLIAEIHQQHYDVIICNFANPDMVGHTGNFPATVKAIETIDNCLARITKALADTGGEALITADHGNAELMHDDHTGQPHTAHTHEKVPALYIGRKARPIQFNGALSDIAPTLLSLIGIKQPEQMTGTPLFELC